MRIVVKMVSNPQSVFSHVRNEAIKLFGEDMVFDGELPPLHTPYPFVYIAQQDTVDLYVKGGDFQTVHQVIRFYHNDIHKRGSLDGMMYQLRMALKERVVFNNSSIAFAYSTQSINPEELPDGLKLMHGVLEIDFRVNSTLGGI